MNLPLLSLCCLLALAAEAAAADAATNAAPAVEESVQTRTIRTSCPPVSAFRASGDHRAESAGSIEDVVMCGLRWLRTQQREDGSWPGNPVVSTSLAVWAYLEHGEVPSADHSEFGPTVERGLAFLLKDLDPESGRFRSACGDPLAQPIGAYALADGSVMTCHPLLREATAASLRPLLEGQRPDGAWNADPFDPSPDGRGDPRMTAWCALATGMAKWCDLRSPLPEEALTHMRDALAAFLDPDSGTVLRPDGSADSATAMVVFALQRWGRWNEPSVKKGVAALEPCVFSFEDWDDPRPCAGNERPFRDWFFVALVKFQEGGKVYVDWIRQVAPETVRTQIVVPAEESGYRDECGRPRAVGYWDSSSEHEASAGSDGPVLPCRRWKGGECAEGTTTPGDRVRDTCLVLIPMAVGRGGGRFLPGRRSFDLPTPPPSGGVRTNADVHVTIRRHHPPSDGK